MQLIIASSYAELNQIDFDLLNVTTEPVQDPTGNCPHAVKCEVDDDEDMGNFCMELLEELACKISLSSSAAYVDRTYTERHTDLAEYGDTTRLEIWVGEL